METIRQARASDKDHVVRLWMDLLRSQSAFDARFIPADDAQVRWRNDFAEWLERESRRLFVSEVDGRVCGFVTAERSSQAPIFQSGAEIYVNELYVEPDVRRRGLGTALFGAVREWAESLSMERIRAGLIAANDEARAFWKAVGGEPITVTMAIELSTPNSGPPDQPEHRRIGF